MLNKIWPFIMVVSIITSFFTGTTEAVATAAVSGAQSGVTFSLELMGIMCFLTGLMKIAEKSNLTAVFAKILSPLTKIIFPEIKPGSPSMNAIVMNMTANMLGMSNAATPLGLRAMHELHKISPDKRRATNAMCRFVIVNTASIQIIPATIIVLRAASGSMSPSEIIIPVWIASVCSVIAGLISSKIFEAVNSFYKKQV